MKSAAERIWHMDEKSWWDSWNRSYRTEDNADATSSELFARVAGVIREVAEPAGCRLLEVACGSGSLSRLLSYSLYHGIDISPAAIDIARSKSNGIGAGGLGSTTYEVGDFHDWPAPRGQFDLAICVDAIAYFRDQRQTLLKMAESLQTSGRLVLTTINPFVYSRIRRTVTNAIQEGSVSNWLSRGELHQLVQSAGFVIERSYTIMPRGNRGILRIINSWRLNQAFGPRVEAVLRDLKERVDLGQYRVVIARKAGRA
jgi:2-polyprenyl-3-methyl-5-hydroxy-6-metoxy-1,4-benzoquinol methylase